MRALIQRVSQASVRVDNDLVGQIQQGLLVFLGVQQGDDQALADKLLHKVMHYRIFPDAQKKINLSVKDIQGELLIVSQFTLVAETHKGLRPGFSRAAEPQIANDLYQYFIDNAATIGQESGIAVETGIFGADMEVALINDGPMTFILDV